MQLSRGEKNTDQFRIGRQPRDKVGQFIVVDIVFGFPEAFGEFIDNKRQN